MKILILNHEFPPLGGGASPVSYEIAKGFMKSGHKVDVITMGFKDLEEFEIINGINIYRVDSGRSKKESSDVYEMWNYINSAKKLIKKLLHEWQENKNLKNNGFRWDICHCHFIIPAGIIASWLKEFAGINYVITSHGSDVPKYNPDRFTFIHNFTRGYLREICKDSEKIICPSNFLKNLIIKEIGDYQEKFSVIRNGIDFKKFKPSRKKKIILCTGRLLERKGFDRVIKALSKEDCGYEIRVIGDGEKIFDLWWLKRQSKTRVNLLGWLDNNSEEYIRNLSEASIYVLPSKMENASISLLEAMSSGCAIITSKGTGTEESIGRDGLLIDPENIEDIKNKIEFLIEKDRIRIEMQKRARKRAIHHYNWKNIIEDYIVILDSKRT